MRFVFLLLLAACVTARAKVDWPEMRGPTQNGHAPNTGLPLHWSEKENIKWKTEIPLRGWSTLAIADGKIWMTTAILRVTIFMSSASMRVPGRFS